MDFYADGNRRQTLGEHINGVHKKTSRFSDSFGCHLWGRLIADWHDLGKFAKAFQEYMLEGGPRVEHAVVGGRYATERFPDDPRKLALQFCITCHHTGLQNFEHVKDRLLKASTLLEEALQNAPEELLSKKLPEWPFWLTPPPRSTETQQIENWKRSLEFWIRMLHSCLVDADWLDAERRDFENPSRPEFQAVEILRDKLDKQINETVLDAKNNNWTPVNQQREIVLNACRAAAKESPGFFSLTVPTGGGKTLSGMSFALNHALKNGLNRVIVVIPYTSIIKQNAKVYAKVFGPENVIEHHSSLTPEKDTERNRLASENWDAPIIVTTNVQFFESLYANKNSKLRKLHNIARSVVILDEVQSLPPRLLYSILDALRELRLHYGCSVVFSTATQPAFKKRAAFFYGLDGVREIIPDTMQLARNLVRVKVEWETDRVTGYAEIKDRIVSEKMDKVLVVTHKRADARQLAELLPPGTYHLSASMCPAHRDAVLERVREELPCKLKTVRLVSTQLIEAGVDIDFPVVFRAMAGLDSISQTAGRCNREGKLKDNEGNLRDGHLIVFRAPTDPPPGVLRLGRDITNSLLKMEASEGVSRCSDGSLDLCSPEIFQTYFRLFYSGIQKDGAGVQTCRSQLDFPEVAKRFQMIDGETYPIVVPYKSAYQKLGEVRGKFLPTREDFRSLQQYIVQIYPNAFEDLRKAGALEPLHEKAFYYLTPQYERLYDQRFGLVVTKENLYPDIEALIL